TARLWHVGRLTHTYPCGVCHQSDGETTAKGARVRTWRPRRCSKPQGHVRICRSQYANDDDFDTPSTTLASMFCPRCAAPTQVRDGRLYCTATDMDFSMVVSKELTNLVANAPAAGVPSKVKWGGTWRCPADG